MDERYHLLIDAAIANVTGNIDVFSDYMADRIADRVAMKIADKICLQLESLKLTTKVRI